MTKRALTKTDPSKLSTTDNPIPGTTPAHLNGRGFMFGNEFWLARSSHGKAPKFTSKTLEDACHQYFQWIVDNPIMLSETKSYKGFESTVINPRPRAMTIQGLCAFIDITPETWDKYRNHRSLEKDKDYSELELAKIRDHNDKVLIATRIGTVIRDQKFQGAALEIFNPNIIARELGLRDLKTHEHSGIDGAPIKSEISVTLQPVASLGVKK